MKTIYTGPFKVIVSLRLLKEKFEQLLQSNNVAIKMESKHALKLFKDHPMLTTGISSLKDLKKEKSVIDELMVNLFPPALTDNEIKAAVLPYSNEIFYCSNRLKGISDNADTDSNIFNDLFKDREDSFDLIAYAVILNKYYQYEVDFDRPKTLSVTNKDGTRKHFRVTFNTDFLDIYPNSNAIEITQDILTELLAKANDENIWKKFFPKDSWTMEGFGLLNLIDTSLDERIDDFKSHLIQPNKESFRSINEDLRRIFNLPNLHQGSYSVENGKITPSFDRNFETLTLSPEDSLVTNEYACNHVSNQLFNKKKPVTIANVEYYHKQSKGNRLSKLLLERGLKSVALIPITVEDNINFIIELATDKANELNAINMVKLETIMPFILSYSARTVTEYQNEISAVIQQECTSIHPSVQWRFEEEASNYVQERNYGDSPVFNEIVFKDILPLYGQTDIVGSSIARNKAIWLDLSEQLKQSKLLLQIRLKNVNLPFYEQLIYQIDKYLFELEKDFHTNSEQEVNLFFEKQLFPLFEHLLVSTTDNGDIKEFTDKLDESTKSLYKARKQYDSTVDNTNKALSSFMEKQQEKAQNMFPHYFEKYKTDGVEHNMYVGQSLVKHETYHPTVLYNLRLWQLQVTCEMEALFYQKHDEIGRASCRERV